LATVIKENNRKILRTLFPYLVLLVLAGKLFGYKTVLLLIFATNLIQQTNAKPTTIQNLYKTIAYIQLREISPWLTFTEDEFKAMETGLLDAIKKLQRTDPLPPTTTTKIPMTNNQLLNGILHSLIKRPDEREETRRQDEQEMIYATE
jgi:hypothetical protein